MTTDNPSAPNPSNLKEMNMRDAKERIENITEDLRSRANRIAHDASDRAIEYYDDATGWISENYGRVLTVVGAAAAVGLAGYLLFKSREEYDSSDREISRRNRFSSM